MVIDHLMDPVSLALVLGGTSLATMLRSGRAELRATGVALAALFARRFDADRARAALSRQVQAIQRSGPIAAIEIAIKDADIAAWNTLYLATRSIDRLNGLHLAQRKSRQLTTERAATTLRQATELAPAFGLAGTLLALAQLPAGGLAPQDVSVAIASAVLTTFYGVVSANLLFAPLAVQITRRSEREESERQILKDWFVAAISSSSDSFAARRQAKAA